MVVEDLEVEMAVEMAVGDLEGVKVVVDSEMAVVATEEPVSGAVG